MQLEDYLKQQSYFSLGHLPTEQLHESTRKLSDWVASDLARAIRTVQEIDVHAIDVVKSSIPRIEELARAIQKTFDQGHRVFLAGCGATGRLALTLESLFRTTYSGSAYENSVHALMAGGDFALVKSVENFEDFPEYGARHLHDLGFKEGDLLIAITEGGETPYVIGTVEGALAHSSQDHWFVYCNPQALLEKTVERSRVVIQNPRVKSLCLPVGPMVLSGSTRLQAASAQMLAVGAALFQSASKSPSAFAGTSIANLIEEFRIGYQQLDLASFLKPAIVWEANQYAMNRGVLYETDDYPIAVLTDTTERSPTFSLAAFENSKATVGPYSLCYLSIPSAKNAHESWLKILHREPEGLNWENYRERLGREAILNFDFGKNAKAIREKHLVPSVQSILKVRKSGNEMIWEAEETKTPLRASPGTAFRSTFVTPLLLHPLSEQLLVKNLLNLHSLMVMGKMNRYEGNVMTWVRASNGKLIDRTLRYLDFLIEKRKLKHPGRDVLIRWVFQMRESIGANDALILKILETKF